MEGKAVDAAAHGRGPEVPMRSVLLAFALSAAPLSQAIAEQVDVELVIAADGSSGNTALWLNFHSERA
jgi:hypothetical protein